MDFDSGRVVDDERLVAESVARSLPEYLIAHALIWAGLHPHLNCKVVGREVDIALDPIVDRPTVVEYDSVRSHVGEGAERRARLKNRVLVDAGWRVIRIRQAPLQPLDADDFIIAIPPSRRRPDVPLLRRIVDHVVTRTGNRIRCLANADEEVLNRLLAFWVAQPDGRQGTVSFRGARSRMELTDWPPQ